jgi:hypothetical protein
MSDFHQLLMRHGECWLQDIIEQIERNEGVGLRTFATLEERWNSIVQAPASKFLSTAA